MSFKIRAFILFFAFCICNIAGNGGNFDENTKLWGNCVPELHNSETSIAHMALSAMKKNGAKVAQINADTGKQLKYKDLFEITVRVAQNLQNRGYKPKQMFGFMVKNSEAVAALMFAAFAMGAIPDMCSVTLGKEDLAPIFERSKPSVIFCDVEFYDLVRESLREAGSNAKIFTLNGEKGDSESVEALFQKTGKETRFIPTKVDGINDVAIKMCSSGTTGTSKGVLLSHAALISGILRTKVVDTNSVILNMNSIDWITSLIALLLATFNGAKRVITEKPYTPEWQLQLIEKYKISFLITPPYQMVSNLKSGLLSKKKLSSIRLQLVCGTKVPFDALNEYNSYLTNGSAVNSYGTSEMASFLTIDYPKSGKDTIGKLLNGLNLKIIDENGNRVGIDMDGEIYVKSSYKFIGYHGRNDLTREVIDDEGFYRTGDIGHVDRDGNIFIVGRAKDLLKYCSKKFAPSDIESFLIKSPDIENVCVTGIPDDLAGDIPVALVVRKTNSRISENDIYQMVANQFPDHYKLRAGVFFVNSIPRNNAGKILRRQAQDIALSCAKGRCE
ncbi:4-coumarate--CoA ligase-like 7 [Contarinia nasturtii]|uniref:4-coumarate--CoA ligase-like 7 n=1 Tax=Contarinia nasturtii TaxID=265458 RepID=UPI0012D457F0|nr:4-coumarate--CoA ligase-like 7 [Contarinia nasturtii]